MARVAIFEKQGPLEVKEAGRHICQCGLSKGFPFCDDSHKRTLDEDPDKLYQYVEGERVVIGQKAGCGGCEGDCHDGCDCEEHDAEEEQEEEKG
jgi:CDGSH-type Zn-finger protein